MKAKSWVITALVCASVTAALAGIKFVQISQAIAFMESFPPAFEAVTVATAEADKWQPSRLLSGTVQSPEHFVISAETPGRIAQLPYQSGETVPAGSKLLVLFDDDVEAQRDALQADLNLATTECPRDSRHGFFSGYLKQTEETEKKPCIWLSSTSVRSYDC